MDYCKVVAIISGADYHQLSDSLAEFDLPGVTVSPVQGFGDDADDLAPDGFSNNLKIEIYTSCEQAEEIAEVLADRALELTDGGGVVAIEPVLALYNVQKLD